MKKTLLALTLGLGLTSMAHAAPERWVVVGDDTHSIVSGAVLNINRPDLLWTTLLQAQSRHQIINIAGGNSGYKYNAGLTTQQVNSALLARPTGIIFAFGTWDWLAGQNLTFVRQELKKHLALAKSMGVKAVCLTPPYRNDYRTRKPNARGWTLNPIPGNIRITYATAIAAECALGGAGVVYSFNAPIALDQVGPQNSFTRSHLRESGHAILAQFIYNSMVNLGHLPPL